MQTTIPLYGFGGGGGTGASLTITAPAGTTVTVSKDGKSKTKVADTDGVAVFKGLSTGDWTVSITDGEQEAQKTVTITADYAAAITFFSATIHVIYPAGSTCTATYGATTLTAPTGTSGTWDFVVDNAGTWTVSLNSGFSEQVEVTEQDATYTVDKWHLYNSGDTYDAVTGGWESNNNFKTWSNTTSDSPAVFGTDSITLKGSKTSQNCVANTVNKVKVGGFSKLCVDLLVSGNAGTDAYGLMSDYGVMQNNLVAGFQTTKSLGRNTHTIDVSAVTSGEYYVAFGLATGAQVSRERTIYSAWFEV